MLTLLLQLFNCSLIYISNQPNNSMYLGMKKWSTHLVKVQIQHGEGTLNVAWLLEPDGLA